MIQIDDAGSGSLIGGTVIGILNTKNHDYYYDIIPLQYYQTDLFQEKAYLDYVIQIIQQGFYHLQVTKEDIIQICPSYMFDRLRPWLTDQQYNWHNSKIEGILQQKVEESFEQYIISLGLPKDFIIHARFAFGFHRLLKWVFADWENRRCLCKTQWKSWRKWGPTEKSIYKNQLTHNDYCLKCGNRIWPNQEVITIEYQTIRPATINLHPSCFQGQLRIIPPLFLQQITTKIKKPKNNLDPQPGLKNTQMILKILANQVLVVNSQDQLLGYLPYNLADKLLFWMEKGFSWKCELMPDGQINLQMKIAEP